MTNACVVWAWHSGSQWLYGLVGYLAVIVPAYVALYWRGRRKKAA